MSLVVDFLEFVERDAPNSVHALLDRFLLKCRLTAGADTGAVYMLRRHGGQRVLDQVARHGGPSPARPGETVSLPLSPVTVPGHVATQGIPIAYDDPAVLRADQPFKDWAARQAGAILCFPVTNFQDTVVAVVELGRGPAAGTFPPDLLPTLLSVARVVSGYIERTDNLEQIGAKNSKLRQRNRTLANQRSRIGELQSETEEAFKTSISLLARAAEIHDEGTGNHCQRVNEYAFFLAGLVTLGSLQAYWLKPLIESLDGTALFFGATGLTAITDNAALTYLGSLVEGISDELKYALVAGAVTGGGLTVIANAPNPAGIGILQDSIVFKDEGVSPTGLFLGALMPTAVAILFFWLCH